MPESFQTFISKEEINALPMFDYPGTYHVIETEEAAIAAVGILAKEKVLGFDTETRPSFTKGESYRVSLLQLATEKEAYLFRLNKFRMPKVLVDLLSSKDVLKAGVGIPDDLNGLKKIVTFTPQGFVDLSLEVKKRGFTSLGLRALTAIFLKKRLSKAAKVTNWERVDLTDAQLKYAALDAYVGLMIYQTMVKNNF